MKTRLFYYIMGQLGMAPIQINDGKTMSFTMYASDRIRASFAELVNRFDISREEVKKDIPSWKWKEKEALFKIQKYEKILGAPCLVLVVEPFPEFHRATKAGLERFASLQAAIDHI